VVVVRGVTVNVVCVRVRDNIISRTELSDRFLARSLRSRTRFLFLVRIRIRQHNIRVRDVEYTSYRISAVCVILIFATYVRTAAACKQWCLCSESFPKRARACDVEIKREKRRRDARYSHRAPPRDTKYDYETHYIKKEKKETEIKQSAWRRRTT